MKRVELVEIEWPEFGETDHPVEIPATVYAERLDKVQTEMKSRNLSHLIVYGDREHFANIAWLTGYDPRFEEALVVLPVTGTGLLLVGNEGEGYLNSSPVYRNGELRAERFQSFSLLDQPRDSSRHLREIFLDEGLEKGSGIGCIGWKYFSSIEFENSAYMIDIPSYIGGFLREIAGYDKVTNTTDMFMHPDYGFRSFCDIHDIAFMEYTNVLASEGMKRMIFGLKPGMIDCDVLRLAEYNGVPLGCHPTCITGSNRDKALSGPIGIEINTGEPFAFNLCYWGSNSCRAGWLVGSADELPSAAVDYVDDFVAPYFSAVVEWFENLKIGVEGGIFDTLIRERLPYEKFGIFLNPGHLIHLDEWLSSPFFSGSVIRLHSGMAIQTDIIPSSERYFSTRVEDGIVLVGPELRKSLQAEYPEIFSRCEKRRNFMVDVLGITVPEDVLPLSNIPGIICPYFFSPEEVMVLR